MSKDKANELKDQGNAFFKENKHAEAIDCYSRGIELDESNHLLYSNRSVAFLKSGNTDLALKDAEKIINLQPYWPKGYLRLCAAYQAKKQFKDAKRACEMGLKHNPGNQVLMESIRECEIQIRDAELANVTNPFEDPGFVKKLEDDPKTGEWMKEPDYKQLIEGLRDNPRDVAKLSDPRILETLGVLMGFEVEDDYEQ